MTMKLFPILVTIITAAGFLVFAIAANVAFAASIDIQQTFSNGLSSIIQSNTQTSSVPSGTSTSTSSNQLVVDSNNQGHAVSSSIVSDPAAGLIGLSNIANGLSSITQSSTQVSSVPSGTSITTSSNQLVVDPNNQGHAVSSVEVFSGP